MDPVEGTTYSFIVKIWVEDATRAAGRAAWRGRVTHVPSNARQYVQDLDDITYVIGSYLQSAGLDIGWRHRLRRWIERRRSRRVR